MVKKAFTLIEIIAVIVIISILSSISLFSINRIYKNFNKTKETTKLLLDAKRVSIQLSNLLSSRIPSTMIGYDPKKGDFASIYNLDKNYSVFEWLSFTKDSFQKGECTFFIDMDRCDKAKKSLFALDTNLSAVNERIKKKFSKTKEDLFKTKDIVLIFAGAFDNGGEFLSKDFKDFYGWHKRGDKKIVKIEKISQNNEFIIQNPPKKIYEKFYFTASAYAIARGEDIDKTALCIKKLPIKIDKNSLLLFYDYRPWKKESFCADKKAQKKAGKVTILSMSVKGFTIKVNNENLVLSLNFEKKLKTNEKISILVQKVLF